MSQDDLVERVAEAIHNAMWAHEYVSVGVIDKELHRQAARAAVEAIQTEMDGRAGNWRTFKSLLLSAATVMYSRAVQADSDTDMRCFDALVETASTFDAEPLKTTQEPKATEGRTEGPLSQDPPPGFEYEYRAVSVIDADDVTPWRQGCPKLSERWRMERRLVGPPERLEED